MTTLYRLVADSVRSLKLWRIWLFLGLQDIKARFRRSFLGPLWIVLTTVFFISGIGVVYGLLFRQPMNEYLPYLACGYTVWGFIVASITESSASFIKAEGYIKQFAYPKQIYLLRTLVSSTVVLLSGLLVLVLVQLFFHKFTLTSWLLVIPGLLLLMLGALGQITISSYIGTRFRDFPHAIGVMLQMLFFITPIMFNAEILKEKGLSFIYQFNPFYYLIEIVRHPLIEGDLTLPENYLFAGVYVLITWIVALLVALKLDSRVVFLL